MIREGQPLGTCSRGSRRATVEAEDSLPLVRAEAPEEQLVSEDLNETLVACIQRVESKLVRL